MVNMDETTVPKSDQLNVDDFKGKPIVIKVTDIKKVDGQQPIIINYEGDNGKPYKPSKGMRRILSQLWGSKGEDYIGRSMQLYVDEKVKFGKLEVGGIRISHLSGIEQDITINLTVSKSNRKPYLIKPLNVVAVAETEVVDFQELSQKQKEVVAGISNIGGTFDQLQDKLEEIIGRKEGDVTKLNDVDCAKIVTYLSNIN
ncbi:hypothetical protein COB55_03065 [Candidatus Wolfebacteria bacterium]|nr:MAG: hypothetical protein COB55_03065 [Candidatus Wolfebacteria bacterium]